MALVAPSIAKPDYGNSKVNFDKVAVSFIITTLILLPQALVYAGDLTDVMKGAGFSGSWELLTKFDFLGWLLSAILTVCGIVGLVIIFAQPAINYLYLFGKPLFDTIAEYQDADKGSGIFGLKGTMKDVFSGNRGTGANALIGFAASLMPNVRNISGYNPERMAAGLDQDDTPWSYTIKAAPQVLMGSIIFVLLFNGTPGKAAATVGEAFVVIADHAVETDLATMADNWASSGQGYTFVIGEGGSPEVKLAERIAKKLYMETIRHAGITESTDKQAIGYKAEEIVSKVIFKDLKTPAEMLTHLNLLLQTASSSSSEAYTPILSRDVGNVKLIVEINTNGIKSVGEIATVFRSENTNASLPMETLLSGSSVKNVTGSNQLYVHIFLLPGKKTNTKFFQARTLSAGSGGGSDPQASTPPPAN